MGMDWKKSSPALVERFTAALPRHPDVTPRKMFGYPASFVGGGFFAGLHEENVVLRVPPAVKDALPALGGAATFDPMKRGAGMKDWWVIPQPVAASAPALQALLADALGLLTAQPAARQRSKPPAKPAAKGRAKPRAAKPGSRRR